MSILYAMDLENKIKELEKENKKLKETEQSLRSIINNLPGAVFWKDTGSVYRGSNLQFAKYCPVKDPEGKTDFDLFSKERAELMRAEDEEVIRTKKTTRVDRFVTLPGGESLWVRISKAPVLDENGEVVSVIGLFEDISERKAAELELYDTNIKYKEAMESAKLASNAKSEFLSRMSHEIRTPLNAIIGMTKIALSSDELAKKQYCLDKIDGASKRLLGLINDILDMSKIEANKLTIISEEFDFDNMVKNVSNVVSVKSEEKRQNFTINIDLNIPKYIISDEMRISQILTNLLFNAIKFTPDNGDIKLNLLNIKTKENSFILQAEVVDTGIGISKEYQKNLFQSFEQADGGVARKFGGTGLGLSICQKLLELMGGRIWIESEEGRGSTFAFSLEIKKGKEAKRDLGFPVNTGAIKALVVDDSKDTRNFFKDILTAAGIGCDTAESGFAAIEMIKKQISETNPYNVLFVDYRMPELDGIDTVAQINRIDGNSAVVIMISVYDWSEIKIRAEEANITRFLQKPIFPSAVFGMINEIMGNIKEGNEEQSEKAYDFSGKTVLLAEDIDINREILVTLVEDTGLTVDCAENGQIAFNMFMENPSKYQMILMDIHMPLMDGYEATRRIRAVNLPQAKRISIVALTANAFKEDIDKCKESGMNDHLAKPIEPDKLFEKLYYYLNETGDNCGIDKSSDNLFREYRNEYIDFNEGIQRLGKRERFISILKTFSGGDKFTELKELLSKNNINGAKETLHALKGTAANLSLIYVKRSAEILETQLKNGLIDNNELDNLEINIVNVEEAIRNL